MKLIINIPENWTDIITKTLSDDNVISNYLINIIMAGIPITDSEEQK